MRPGDVVADRFEVEREAGSGGMSTVYRARDRHAGTTVALKVLRADDDGVVERFAREARLVAELRHPGIVKYVAHGVTPAGARWLALEWLDGEDLEHRIDREGLTPEEGINIVRAVADALAAAHARGVVHRDVKPSNIFLGGGRSTDVKVLDFGVARAHAGALQAVDGTRAGSLIGTPAYMAPEQARGQSDVDARADVYALGCVLFKCLTGQKPFTSQDPLSLLAKIVLEPAPRVRELRPELPSAVDDLVARMLAKDPAARPRDAAAVRAELDRMPLLTISTRMRAVATAALTFGERRFLCLVVAIDVAPDASREALERAAEAMGGQLDSLFGGMMVVSVSSSGASTELAARAARCALFLRALVPTAPMAIAGGLVDERAAASVIIERAAALLRARATRDEEASERRTSAPPSMPARVRSSRPPIRELPLQLDEGMAGLLGTQFNVRRSGDGFELRGRESAEGLRLLLGKPTPFVSRDAEIGTLEAVFGAACNDSQARAVLVTAPAGSGKSRLRYEFVRRLRNRGEPVEVWIGRGDPMSAGTPFGLLADAVRRAAGLSEGEPPAVLRQKLLARVGRYVALDKDKERIASFVGELIGVPFDDASEVALRAARQDVQLLADQMARAWEDWVRAETTAQPLLLVLEDLHWGDVPTVRFVDRALRNLKDCPLMVVALARPDVHEAFPNLWAGRGVSEIRLGELSKKACEKLAREVLGGRADDATVKRLVERSAGNAFYLEELIRAAAEGKADRLPESVLAMVEARLEAMEPMARQVLRAASVFGQVFWLGGVHALLASSPAREVDEWLDVLVEREVVSRRGAGKFAGETELVFRHALVRDAAYAMLTDADRTLGHDLAATWLERAGEHEANVLVEHHERGGRPRDAAQWCARAAQQALGGDDLAGALAAVERGKKNGAAGEVLGALLLVEAEAARWQGVFATSLTASLAAMQLLGPASDAWFVAAEHAAYASGRDSGGARLPEIAALLRGTGGLEGDGMATASAVAVRAWACLADRAKLIGTCLDVATEAFARIEPRLAALRETDPVVAANVTSALAVRTYLEGNPGPLAALVHTTVPVLEAAGDFRSACRDRGHAGFALYELGCYPQAEQALREVVGVAERMGLGNVAATARQNLGLVLHRVGRLEEARALQTEAAAFFARTGDRRMEAACRAYVSAARLADGDLEGAEADARAALLLAEGPPVLPLNEAEALSHLAAVMLARGDAKDAVHAAGEAARRVDEAGGIDGGEAFIYLLHAEALHATGAHAEAHAAIEKARARLVARADKVGDGALRRSFLEAVDENRRTLDLARAWMTTGAA